MERAGGAFSRRKSGILQEIREGGFQNRPIGAALKTAAWVVAKTPRHCRTIIRHKTSTFAHHPRRAEVTKMQKCTSTGHRQRRRLNGRPGRGKPPGGGNPCPSGGVREGTVVRNRKKSARAGAPEKVGSRWSTQCTNCHSTHPLLAFSSPVLGGYPPKKVHFLLKSCVCGYRLGRVEQAV